MDHSSERAGWISHTSAWKNSLVCKKKVMAVSIKRPSLLLSYCYSGSRSRFPRKRLTTIRSLLTASAQSGPCESSVTFVARKVGEWVGDLPGQAILRLARLSLSPSQAWSLSLWLLLHSSILFWCSHTHCLRNCDTQFLFSPEFSSSKASKTSAASTSFWDVTNWRKFLCRNRRFSWPNRRRKLSSDADCRDAPIKHFRFV